MARQLEIAITDSSSTIRVSPPFNRGDFPERGIIQIENERIGYENTTENEFLLCTRGYLGSTAVAHAKGVTVSFFTELATTKEINTSVEVLSPASIPADIVNSTDIIIITTAAPDTLVLTIPSPTASPVGRLLSIVHKTGSLGTLTINGTDLAAGESKEFVWDGSGWSQSPAAGGGSASGWEVLSNVATLEAASTAAKLGDDKNLILSNDDLAYFGYSTDHGTLFVKSGGVSSCEIAAAGELILYANTDFDASGSFDPHITMSPNGNLNLQNTGQGDAANRKLRVIMDQAFDAGTHNQFRCEKSASIPVLDIGYFANGSAITGAYINSQDNKPLNLGMNTSEQSAQLDDSATADDTRLLLWDVTAGTLVRVSRGAADSGGTGFRALRIPN